MAIPDFDENGNLPEGIWDATIDEIQERFGSMPTRRRMQFSFLLNAITLLKAAGCTALFLDGSYVTDKVTPEDFDALIEKFGEKVDVKIMLAKYMEAPKKYRGEFYYADFLAYDKYQKKRVSYLELFQTEWRDNDELIRKGIIKIQLT